ncbi:uncharacterized protein LOC144218377 [Crocuta crocuta]
MAAVLSKRGSSRLELGSSPSTPQSGLSGVASGNPKEVQQFHPVWRWKASAPLKMSLLAEQRPLVDCRQPAGLVPSCHCLTPSGEKRKAPDKNLNSRQQHG